MRTVFINVAILFSALIVAIPADTQVQNPRAAHPGSINYVEGQASIGSTALSPDSAGSAELEKGQSLTTQSGKVEILLTPGVFLRVAENSTVKMISPELTNTEVELDKGRAMIEALEVRKENDIRVDQNDAYTRLLKNGLYDFDADNAVMRVFKGGAEVGVNDQKVKVSGEHELSLNAPGKPKSRNFDTRRYEDDFFRWSALRSGYLSEASVDEARIYIGTGPGWYGPGWFGTGWYWDPWFGVWTFIPAESMFYSPFGWGFYSPIFVYRSPFFYWGYWGHQIHHFGDFHEPYGHGVEPPGGFRGGGFHGGTPVPRSGAPRGGAPRGGSHR